MKKSKLFLSSFVALTTTSTIIGISAPSITSKVKNSANSNISTLQNSNINTKNSIPLTTATINSKTIKRSSRKVNNFVYRTDLMTNYGSRFKYPSWNYNYESGNNKYLKLSNGKTINMMDLVYNERIDFNGKKVTYANPDWIQDQIRNNQLKRHPAANTFYKNSISDNAKSVTKEYTISTDITGPITLGLYAPPGEVITLKLDDITFNKMNFSNYNFGISINDNYWDNYEEGDSGQISNRYPYLSSTFKVNVSNKTVQFGSPFGGAISIHLNKVLWVNGTSQNIKFTVSGAVENLYYIQGKTTEQDWNNQLNKIKSGEISSPIFSFVYDWGSANLPLDDYDLTLIPYPKDIIRKWNEFTYLSSYIAGFDLKRTQKFRINLRFCDDIPYGAGGLGGSGGVWVPISWGLNGFSKGLEGFSITGSWGLMHEINHTFEQSGALFKKRGHGETNQVTIAALAMLSDTGINRNPANTNNEYASPNKLDWNRLGNQYTTINWLLDRTSGSVDEYPIYSLLLNTVGPKGYIEYIRKDSISGNNLDDNNWTGLNEIIDISNYYGVNFWPVFQKYGKYWRDSWPTSLATATTQEQKLIKNLYNKGYKVQDFVGNFYAAGSYLYNSKTNDYIYTGDTQAPYQIAAGENYVFDFGKYINSLNPDFSWSDIEIPNESKQGVKLVKNGKKVVYKAADKFTSEIDEFDIVIKAKGSSEDLNDYVPGYKWKIKILQNVSSASLYIYDNFKNPKISNKEGFKQLQNNDYKYSYPISSFDKKIYYISSDVDRKTKNGMRIKFTYIAPSTNNYEFYSKFNDAFLLKINNKEVFISNKTSSNLKRVYKTKLSKGDKLLFDLFVINHDGNIQFDMQTKIGNNLINSNDLLSNILIPNLNNLMRLTNYKISPSIFLTSDNYKYKLRWVNLNELK